MKKLIPLFTILIIGLYSCKKEPKKTYTQPKDIPLSERPIPKLPNSNVTSGVVGGAHYICPNNCQGGTSGSQGTCSVCNSELAHNQGFHTQQNSTPSTPNPSNSTPASGPNANGQYHYTCDNGCAGGASSLGECATCSRKLTHNQAFHN